LPWIFSGFYRQENEAGGFRKKVRRPTYVKLVTLAGWRLVLGNSI
jgi:hypothetical protein